MSYRTLLLFSMALALTLFVSRPAFADEMTHEGKVVSVTDGKLTMSHKNDDKQYTHDVSKEAKITLDGKKAKLDDLKESYHVKVTMDDKHKLIKIEAHSK